MTSKVVLNININTTTKKVDVNIVIVFRMLFLLLEYTKHLLIFIIINTTITYILVTTIIIIITCMTNIRIYVIIMIIVFMLDRVLFSYFLMKELQRSFAMFLTKYSVCFFEYCYFEKTLIFVTRFTCLQRSQAQPVLSLF